MAETRQAELDSRVVSLNIDRWLADPSAQRTVVEMYESVSFQSGTLAARSGRQEIHRYIKPRVLEAFRRGELLLRRESHVSVISIDKPEPKSPVSHDEEPPPPPAPVPRKTWIEIELVDEDDNPVPNQAFRLVLPDGTTRSGTLGENGKYRVSGIDPGTCKVSFPDFDAGEWEKV